MENKSKYQLAKEKKEAKLAEEKRLLKEKQEKGFYICANRNQGGWYSTGFTFPCDKEINIKKDTHYTFDVYMAGMQYITCSLKCWYFKYLQLCKHNFYKTDLNTIMDCWNVTDKKDYLSLIYKINPELAEVLTGGPFSLKEASVIYRFFYEEDFTINTDDQIVDIHSDYYFCYKNNTRNILCSNYEHLEMERIIKNLDDLKEFLNTEDLKDINKKHRNWILNEIVKIYNEEGKDKYKFAVINELYKKLEDFKEFEG